MKTFKWITLVAGVATGLACGGGSGLIQPFLFFTSTPMSRTIAPDASADFTLDVTSRSTSNSQVHFTVTDLPADVTGTFSDDTIDGSETSTVLTIHVGPAAAKKATTFHVTAQEVGTSSSRTLAPTIIVGP